MKLLAAADNSRFFLIPDGLVLGKGEMEVKSMTGDRFQASPAILDAYQVPSAVAKAFAEQATSAMAAELVDMQVRLSESMARAQAELRRVTAHAGFGEDPKAILAKLGLNPKGSPEDLLVRLAEIARTVGEQAPKVVAGTLDAHQALANLDATLGGAGADGGSVEKILDDFAGPANSPELREAALRLAEMHKKLQES